MVGWHHRLNEHGFGWTLGVGDGQGGLACCGSWGHKQSNTTEPLNWTDGETSYCPREYIYHHEQDIARNMSVQGAFYEVLAWPLITKYYELGGLNNRHLFLIVLETGKFKVKVWTDLVPGEGISVWLKDDCLLTVLSHKNSLFFL